MPRPWFATITPLTVASALLLAAAVPFPLARAQQATTTGTVRGVVSSSDGARLPSVTVIATNTESGVPAGLTD